MFPRPLFEQKEAFLLLGWLDRVDAQPVPAETIEKLKSLVMLWAR